MSRDNGRSLEHSVYGSPSSYKAHDEVLSGTTVHRGSCDFTGSRGFRVNYCVWQILVIMVDRSWDLIAGRKRRWVGGSGAEAGL